MEKDTPIYVYRLVDAATGTIGYVGQTSEPRSRYVNHLHPDELNGARWRWIEKCMSRGSIPFMELICKVKSHANEVEAYFIWKYKREGHPLTNSANDVTTTQYLNYLEHLSGRNTKRAEKRIETYFERMPRPAMYDVVSVKAEIAGFPEQASERLRSCLDKDVHMGRVRCQGVSLRGESALRMQRDGLVDLLISILQERQACE